MRPRFLFASFSFSGTEKKKKSAIKKALSRIPEKGFLKYLWSTCNPVSAGRRLFSENPGDRQGFQLEVDLLFHLLDFPRNLLGQ